MVTSELFFLISLLITRINTAYITVFVEHASPVKIICFSYYLTEFATVGTSSVFLNSLPATSGVLD